MNIRAIVLFAAAVLAVGCGSGTGSSKGQADGKLRAFPKVTVPGVYSSDGSRAAYAAEHYWDLFFKGAEGMQCDTVTVCGVSGKEFEEAFSAYIVLLEEQNIILGKNNINALFDKVEALQRADTLSNVYTVFSFMMNHYLFDANSPLRNEDLYQSYVARLAECPLTKPELVPAYSYDAYMCSLNAYGTPAADFTFKDAAGRSHRLHDVEAEYTLLFFSNPGCSACKEIVSSIIEKSGDMVASGLLAVVSVYIDDDIASWRKSVSEYPKSWYVGYDPSGVIRNGLYNIRGIPSLYMLDKDKRVIFKDAPEQIIFDFVDSMNRLLN